MQKRNLIILVFCQLISATGSIVFVTLGPIIGANLTTNQAFSTLPVSLMVVSVAITTVPATMLMRRIGRRSGFAAASASAIIAVIVAILALRAESFAAFLAATLLFGINMAFTQQYRYAAAESVEARYVPRAISFVLIGSIGGALVGPELIKQGQLWVRDLPYTGAMTAVACLYGLQALLFLFLQRTAIDDVPHVDKSSRALWGIVRQPVFLVAVLGGTAGYGLMTLVMTATPLSMNVNDGYSIEQTSNVIRAHVLGMYLPSLVSGFLIERLGVIRMMFVGVLALVATSIVGLQGHAFLHYWWALVLLGIGWNFLFVGGTTMLTYTYTVSERFRAQGISEFLVFGTSATASLLAGTVMFYFGWDSLMLIPLPILALVGAALIWVRRDRLLDRSPVRSAARESV